MLEKALSLYESGHWITQVFLVSLAVVSINFLIRRVLRNLGERVRRSENVWDDALFESINPPLRALIWVIGLSVCAELVEPQAGDALFAMVEPARRVAVIALFVWFLLRLVTRVEANLVLKARRDDMEFDQTTFDAIGKLLRAAIMITGVLVILQTLGFSISGVLAFGGVGGLAVGFAAKDMLANFFGGLTVYLDKPFRVGDWIRSPEQDIEGTVEKIGWRSTCIRRFNKRPIYVPNALFTSLTVENPSRMTNRRIYENVGVRYDDFDTVEDICDEVRKLLTGHEDIDQDQTIMVNFNAFGPSSLDIMVYCLTRTTNWAEYHRVKQDVLLRIGRIIEARGAEIAFPTRTLHLVGSDDAATGTAALDSPSGNRPAND